MIRNGMTINEAAHEWVREFNAIPQGMIQKLMAADPDDWREVTTPAVNDRVYVYGKGSGTIIGIKESEGDVLYLVEMDESLLKPVYGDEFDDGSRAKEIEAAEDDFEVEYDDTLPMWSTMWSFGDSLDDYWLEELNGIEIMSRCGFRIYESEEFGYFFGIDAAGYDFYEAFWIPLYKARGLQWHDTETESKEAV
ncbi:MAG: hypothetical protein II126_04965 [Erysipelotrichaceae bacterium]|nr:hypothetical protein [Erysipelotrichaceae bacterium]